jgi:hypothetical protein
MNIIAAIINRLITSVCSMPWAPVDHAKMMPKNKSTAIAIDPKTVFNSIRGTCSKLQEFNFAPKSARQLTCGCDARDKTFLVTYYALFHFLLSHRTILATNTNDLMDNLVDFPPVPARAIA